MYSRRPSLLLGVALALGSRLAGTQATRAPQSPRSPGTHKATRLTRPQKWSGFLAERRRWLIRWAPAGGGHRERARRQRQIAAGTVNSSSGLIRFDSN